MMTLLRAGWAGAAAGAPRFAPTTAPPDRMLADGASSSTASASASNGIRSDGSIRSDQEQQRHCYGVEHA